VRRQRALAEQAVGALDELRQRQADFDERVEHRVQVRHQHRCCHALPRYVAQHEVQAAVRRGHQVAVVAADDAEGTIEIGRLPPAMEDVRRRQEPALDARGEPKVFLERALLRR
jgi:hypothetical protein